MGHDKELTGVIVLFWVVIVILIVGVSDKPAQQELYSNQPIRREVTGEIQMKGKTEADVTVYVISNKEEFCGSSTMGQCSSDSDCVESGCSGQICQSRNEKSMVTTCEWKDCYNNEKYGLSCRCVNNQCQWK